MGHTSSGFHLTDRRSSSRGEEASGAVVPTAENEDPSATAALSQPIWHQEAHAPNGRAPNNGPDESGLDGASSSPQTPTGHVRELAELLQAAPTTSGADEKAAEFPDVFRVPIPNQVFRGARRASAPAARLAFLLARHAYRYEPENGAWRASPRWSTFSDLREYFRTGLALAPATATRAARELETKGLIELKGGGQGNPLQMRWALSAPSARFTYLPTALVELHGRVSHSAWAVLVQVYHRTWGRTRREWRDGGHVTLHPRRARLPHADLAELAGLSVETVRSATDELVDKSLLDRERPQGDAYHYRPTSPEKDARFFRIGRGDSNKDNGRDSGARTRRPKAHSSNGVDSDSHTEGRIEEAEMADRVNASRQIPEVSVPPGNGPPESFSAVEEGLYDTLTSPSGFQLPRAWTIRMIKGRSAESIRSTLRAYQRQKSDIETPSGWLRTALEKQWFAPSTSESSSCGTSAARGSRGCTEGEPGVAHNTMCNLIQALNQPEFGWEVVDRSGQVPRFVPSKNLANWAYIRRQSESEEFQKAARTIVNLRAHYEDRESPLSGD